MFVEICQRYLRVTNHHRWTAAAVLPRTTGLLIRGDSGDGAVFHSKKIDGLIPKKHGCCTDGSGWFTNHARICPSKITIRKWNGYQKIGCITIQKMVDAYYVVVVLKSDQLCIIVCTSQFMGLPPSEFSTMSDFWCIKGYVTSPRFATLEIR